MTNQHKPLLLIILEAVVTVIAKTNAVANAERPVWEEYGPRPQHND